MKEAKPSSAPTIALIAVAFNMVILAVLLWMRIEKLETRARELQVQVNQLQEDVRALRR